MGFCETEEWFCFYFFGAADVLWHLNPVEASSSMCSWPTTICWRRSIKYVFIIIILIGQGCWFSSVSMYVCKCVRVCASVYCLSRLGQEQRETLHNHSGLATISGSPSIVFSRVSIFHWSLSALIQRWDTHQHHRGEKNPVSPCSDTLYFMLSTYNCYNHSGILASSPLFELHHTVSVSVGTLCYEGCLTAAEVQ